MLRYEREALSRGALRVCGIDEVGRGPLAGPLVAVAVVLPPNFHHFTLTDSKKLTPRRREALHDELTTLPGLQWSAAQIEPEEIDQINILQATWKAMVTARSNLDPAPDWTLVDGLHVPPLGNRQISLIKGDSLSLSIAAASVIAKVIRDRQMLAMDTLYPGYGFAKHKGYGTALHQEALNRLGPCPIHRRSFGPVRRTISNP